MPLFFARAQGNQGVLIHKCAAFRIHCPLDRLLPFDFQMAERERFSTRVLQGLFLHDSRYNECYNEGKDQDLDESYQT